MKHRLTPCSGAYRTADRWNNYTESHVRQRQSFSCFSRVRTLVVAILKLITFANIYRM